MIRFSVCCLLCCCILLFTGCGPRGKGLRVEFVEGVVTLNGQPVAGASIMFSPATPGGPTEAAGGSSNASGVYRLSSMNGDPERGAVAGDYIVTVSKIEVTDPDAGKSYEEQTQSTAVLITRHLLPEIYLDNARTPLRATVSRGRNTIDLELLSNP